MISRIETVDWGLVVVLMLFRVAVGKMVMVVTDPIFWVRSLKFWGH